jgi:hypothetical protein
MSRRILMTAVALMFPAGLIAVSSGTAWASPNAHGKAACTIVGGSGNVSPGLSPAGAIGGIKINFSASMSLAAGSKCASSVTTPLGVTVIGGTVTGSGYYLPVAPQTKASKCANFDAGGTDKVGVITVTIKWLTAGPAIAPTTIVYKNLRNTVTGAVVDTITLKHPPNPGTAVKSGSFSFPPAGAPNTTQIVTTLPSNTPPCVGTHSAFTITGGYVSM